MPPLTPHLPRQTPHPSNRDWATTRATPHRRLVPIQLQLQLQLPGLVEVSVRLRGATSRLSTTPGGQLLPRWQLQQQTQLSDAW